MPGEETPVVLSPQVIDAIEKAVGKAVGKAVPEAVGAALTDKDVLEKIRKAMVKSDADKPVTVGEFQLRLEKGLERLNCSSRSVEFDPNKLLADLWLCGTKRLLRSYFWFCRC